MVFEVYLYREGLIDQVPSSRPYLWRRADVTSSAALAILISINDS